MVGILLKYAGEFLSERCGNFLYIPFFIVLTIGLIVLCVFQYLAFTSNDDPVPKEGDVYLHSSANAALTILTVIEFIWGLQFLKDACNILINLVNFIISGNAT